jgi:ligand-binding sensor protein/two-component sensor histidine kinase
VNPVSFRLEEIINIKILQEIQDKFAEVTGLAAVITNAEGKPVTKPSNFSKFCQYIRSSPAGLKCCMNSDAKGGREAMQRREAVVYTCHTGLTDLAAPIIVNNQYMGVFLCGQILLPDSPMHNPQVIWERNKRLALDREILLERFKEIETTTENKIKAAAELLIIMTNYIVEMGIANIVQKQLMSEMKAKTELERILRETEYKALQSQINPHFLFNSLNTIARLALTEGANKTQEVIYALSDLLRNSLKNSDKIISLQEEIKYIKEYLLIQETRFSDRIKVFFDIDDQTLTTKLPSMTLQPLVENAIVHGLEPKKDGGILRITARRADDQVMIEISDTGMGIPRSKVEKLLIRKDMNSSGQITGLGVANVHRRIQYHFGEEYGLKIESRLTHGTKVTVTIPFLE